MIIWECSVLVLSFGRLAWGQTDNLTSLFFYNLTIAPNASKKVIWKLSKKKKVIWNSSDQNWTVEWMGLIWAEEQQSWDVGPVGAVAASRDSRPHRGHFPSQWFLLINYLFIFNLFGPQKTKLKKKKRKISAGRSRHSSDFPPSSFPPKYFRRHSLSIISPPSSFFISPVLSKGSSRPPP